MDCKLRAKNCGGCPMLGMDYAAQLKQKEETVKKLLGRFGPVEHIRGMETPYHYRNKVISTFTTGWGGKLTSGIYAVRTHKVLPVESCLLQDEVLDKVMLAVRAAANPCRYQPFHEDKGTGLLRHLYFRKGQATGQVLACIVINGTDLPGGDALCAALRAAVPGLVGVVLNSNTRRTNVILGDRDRVLWGKGELLDKLCGKTFAIGPHAFYQVNHDQCERLYALAGDFAGLTGDQVLLDLYCGVGTIGLTLADRCRRLIGVEVVPQAVENARENARRNGIENAEFLCADAAGAATQLASQGVRPDVAIVDPPRKGCAPEVFAAIDKMGIERLVYVSCDPATLARDLALLATMGYTARRACGVDLFPRTPHVETVVLVERDD